MLPVPVFVMSCSDASVWDSLCRRRIFIALSSKRTEKMNAYKAVSIDSGLPSFSTEIYSPLKEREYKYNKWGWGGMLLKSLSKSGRIAH